MKNIKMLLDNGFDPDLRVYKEAKYISSQGYNVEILCLDRKNTYIDKPKEDFDGIQITRFYPRTKKITEIINKNRIIEKIKYIIYMFWFFKYIHYIREYLKDKDYEILHCHDLSMALCGTIFFRKKKIVFDMHEYYANKKNKMYNWFINKAVKYVQKRATWIINVNEFQIKDLKQKDKLVFLPNYPLKGKLEGIKHTNSKELRISYIGYVRHYTTLYNLMKATDELSNVKVIINGSGDAYNSLLEKAKMLKNTILTGPYNYNDIDKLYANTDLVYIVYNQGNKNDETALPTKLFEAIITETPMIVSKNSAMGEFVKKHDIGFVVDGTDKDSIKEIIKQIQENTELLEKKKENLEKMSNQYSWEDIVKNLRKIYI